MPDGTTQENVTTTPKPAVASMPNKEPDCGAWRWKLLLAVAAVCACVIFGWWILFVPPSAPDSQTVWTTWQLDSKIRTDLSGPQTRADVEAWLDRNAISHKYTTDLGAVVIGHDTIPELAGVQHLPLAGMVWGTLGEEQSRGSVLVPTRISVYFFIDKNDQCRGHYVEAFGFWP
jgi:hypothetical protein